MATPQDADAVAEIYLPYVRDTAISFETVPPDAEEMRSRITTTLALLPWLVVTDDDCVKGLPTRAPIAHVRPTAGLSTCRYTWTNRFTAKGTAAGSTLCC
jgi:hypothetical protein